MPRACSADILNADPERAEAVDRLLALLRAAHFCAEGLRTAIEAIGRRHSLVSSQLLALWACRQTPGGLGQTDLAARVGVSPAQTSALVEQLRRRGLLICERTATDRRRQVWSLTGAGSEVIAAALEDLIAMAGRCDGVLAPSKNHVVCEQLTALAATAKDATGDSTSLRLVQPPDEGVEGQR